MKYLLIFLLFIQPLLAGTVLDALRLGAKQLTLAASGPIGNANTTVDISPAAVITASVPGLVFTLPNSSKALPLLTEFTVVASGVNAFSVNGVLMNPGNFATFVSSGNSGWNALKTTSDWSIAGNADITAGSMLGTTNLQPIRMVTNNVNRMFISPTGDVGVGTVTPDNRLAVYSNLPDTSGVRLQRLTTTSPSSLTTNKVLAVNSNGDIINAIVPGTENIVEFSVNANPNTAGTTFDPAQPGDRDIVYFSTIDNSTWRWNGTAYVTFVPVSNSWALNGNTVPAQRSFGTINNFSIPFITNNIERMRLTNTGQLGVGVLAPPTATLFDVSSTTKGSMPFPRMTTAQRVAIATPVQGLHVYDTTTNSQWYHNGTVWVNLGVTNSLMQVAYAAGEVNIGDPVPTGARAVTNGFNVTSATGLDGQLGDTRLQVVFTTPIASTNYIVVGQLRSVTPANWNSDNDVTFTIAERLTTGFTLAFKEYNPISQNLFFDFRVIGSESTTGPLPITTSKYVGITTGNPVVSVGNIQLRYNATNTNIEISTVTGTETVLAYAGTDFNSGQFDVAYASQAVTTAWATFGDPGVVAGGEKRDYRISTVATGDSRGWEFRFLLVNTKIMLKLEAW